MKTDQISVLQAHDFVIEKTRDYTTVISSTKPFNIHGNSGIIAASLNEQAKYSVTFAGLCMHDQIPNLIEQSKFPMIADAQSRAVFEQHTQSSADTTQNHSISFADLVEQELFGKTSDQICYRKVTDTTYVKNGSLVESLELIATEDMVVYVAEAVDTRLTSEQKHMIVDSLPDNLQRYDFDEVLGMALENIAGVDSMSTQAIARLHKELYKMYASKH